MDNTCAFTVRVSPAIRDMIADESRNTGESNATVVRQILRMWCLKKLEEDENHAESKS